MTRYLSGLCVAGLGLCGGGWLVVAAVAFGGMDSGDAGRANLATGLVLILVCCVTAVAWVVAWRTRMRADGVLGDPFASVSRRQARHNRRELTRDVRRAARAAKRSASEARRRARRFPRLANGGLDVGLGGLGLGFGGQGGGGLTGTGPLGSGLSGGGLGEPRGWIGGGGRPGYAPHGPGPGRQGPPGPSTTEVLVELRTLRSLLTPLLESTAPQPVVPPMEEEPQPAVPPLPQRQPGQGPAIPRQPRADQPGAEPSVQAPVEAPVQVQAPVEVPVQVQAPVQAPVQPDGLIAGEGELLKLADSEEAWW